jgi:hypothetical protein
VSLWPDADDAFARANAGTRRGDELMAAGLVLDARRDDAAGRGDFIARLFTLEVE